MTRVLLGAFLGAVALGAAGVISTAPASSEGTDPHPVSPVMTSAPEQDGAHDREKDPRVVGPEPVTAEEYARDAHDPSDNGRQPATGPEAFAGVHN